MIKSKTALILILAINAIAPAAVWLLISTRALMGPYPYQNFSGPVAERVGLKQPDRFRLAVLSDVHNNTAGFEAVMDDVSRSGADAAIVLGDFTHRGLLVEKQLFISQVAESQWGIPLYTLIGNHDLDHGLESGNDYREFFGADHYWWRFGNNLFIVVNNVERDLREEQYGDVVKTIAARATPDDSIYLMMHRPVFDADGDRIEWEKRFKRVVSPDGIPGLKVILCGHLHHYEEHEIGGVRIIAAGNNGDFDDKRAEIPLQYLMMDCSRDGCGIARRELGTRPARSTPAHRWLVDYYYFWPVYALVSWAGLGAGLVWSRRRQ